MNTLIPLLTRILSAFLMMTHYWFGLIVYPYKSMRKIAKERDILQIILIFGFIYLYFIFGTTVRKQTLHPFIISSSSFVSFSVFFLTFFLTISFFYFVGGFTNKKGDFQSLLFTFSYSLLPTLVWFFGASLLYYLLPPPRTFSFWGKSFSVFFMVFSLTLLWWRLILLYLALRFSLKAHFYTLLGFIVLYMAWFLPYSYGMYRLRLFRIPFI